MLKFACSSAFGCAASACYSNSTRQEDSSSFSESLSSSSSSSSSSCSSSSSTAQCAAAAGFPGGPCVFSPDEWQKFRFLSQKYETHDTRRFFFALPGGAEQVTNLPLGSCILVKYHDSAEGKDVIRPYTPITGHSTKGSFELLVKRYPKSKMGHHIHTLRPGEDISVKGPIGKFDYKPGKFSHLGMIAAGTGITPMFQLIQGILENPADSKTKVSLCYTNKARNDLLLATELSEYQKIYKQFQLYLTLTQSSPWRWLGGVGHINKAMLENLMPKPGEKDTMILVCGPPPFMKAISGEKDFSGGGVPEQGKVTGLLKEMGYSERQVYKF